MSPFDFEAPKSNCILVQNLPHATDVLLDQTQQIYPTQELGDGALLPISSRHGSPVPSAVTDAFASINITSGVDHPAAGPHQDTGIDTQIFRNVAMSQRNTYSRTSEHSEISCMSPSAFCIRFDLPHGTAVNTPTQPRAILEDQIESFPIDGAYDAAEDIMETQEPNDISVPSQSAQNLVDNGLNCECGVSVIRLRHLSGVVN